MKIVSDALSHPLGINSNPVQASRFQKYAVSISDQIAPGIFLVILHSLVWIVSGLIVVLMLVIVGGVTIAGTLNRALVKVRC